ncbi:DUF2059 domain-containing protein [uncultured Erythrobacter sp.]|uniref:DUF2059 domain-containing protein n=1 Tax=uncultured Erythrobacter sp. TaxID=263913 RepID=UPI002619E499|nr:DUF2059 domain-containing protein [uncultured Erythrobacter sp.]
MMHHSKKIVLCAAVALAALPYAANAQDSSDPAIEAPNEVNLAIARQIVDLGFPVETREQIFFGTMDQMVAQTREATLRAYELEDEGAIAIMDQWVADYMEDSKDVLRSHIPSLIDGLAASYAAIFTRRELEDILAFVSTPSGQRYFELSSAILAEPNFAAANQAYMNDSQALLPGAMNDLIERLRTYMAEQQAAGEQVTS